MTLAKMTTSRNMLLLSALFLSGISCSSAVTVSGISMFNGSSHLAQLQAKATLECQHTLIDGETVEKLGWFREGVPVMTWTPPDEAVVVGSDFRGRLDVSDNNGSLVFSKVTVDDAGSYTCTIQSNSGKQDSSQDYTLVVADVPTDGFKMHGNVADCILYFSFKSLPIYPKPTPLCGIWSTDTNFTNTATDWQAVPYYNGSVAYSIEDTTFSVRGMPLQAGIRCEMSFPPPAGATDTNKIIAWTQTAYYPQVSERGCPALEVGDDITVHYKNHRVTCRGELTAQDPGYQLVAMIKCNAGKKSSLRGGGMSGLQLTCSRRQWEPVGGVSWNEFEDMECTDDPDGVESSIGSNQLEPLVAEPVAEAEPSDATVITATSAIVAVLAIVNFIY